MTAISADTTSATDWNVGPAEHSRLAELAETDHVAFWEQVAARLDWAEPWHTAHTWEPAVPDPQRPGQLTVPRATWFAGGRLNASVQCVDRHVAAGRGDRVALHFEGEAGDRRTVTYADLQREVSRAANALTALGVGPGDRVVLYLPVLVETIVAALAVARIGAVHSLVFGGFSAEALRFRLADLRAKVLITSDGQFRRGRAVATKPAADEAVADLEHVEHVLVVRRTADATADVPWTPGRDVWWHEALAAAADTHAPEDFDAEHPLFVIYTSGTTGRPKGLVHTTGGYLAQASWTQWACFDARDDDVYWCTADLAWVTAHTYVLYGPLSNGVTQVIYEGTPDTPHPARHFEIIQRYRVTTYYTAPTLVRTLATRFPGGPPPEYDLSSIRLLGSVGEAINPAAWRWFHDEVGGGRAPVVDTWWQSETGAAMIAPLPGVSPRKPGSATRPLPGIIASVVDDDGVPVPPEGHGLLVVRRPWPGMARTVWGDPDRYRDSYWSRFAHQGWYLAGDGARVDTDGDFWILGRVDEVINVSGHRLSTVEIESALVAHDLVGEAGVTGVPDAVTGQSVVAFVVPAVAPAPPQDAPAWAAHARAVQTELAAHVARVIGPIAKPRRVVVVPDLPKTRSGKIMRRLLADLVAGRSLGDVTSLTDPGSVDRVAAVLAAGASSAQGPVPGTADLTTRTSSACVDAAASRADREDVA